MLMLVPLIVPIFINRTAENELLNFFRLTGEID